MEKLLILNLRAGLRGEKGFIFLSLVPPGLKIFEKPNLLEVRFKRTMKLTESPPRASLSLTKSHFRDIYILNIYSPNSGGFERIRNAHKTTFRPRVRGISLPKKRRRACPPLFFLCGSRERHRRLA